MNGEEVQSLTDLSVISTQNIYQRINLQQLCDEKTCNLLDVVEDFRREGMLVIIGYLSQIEMFCAELSQMSTDDPYKAADILTLKRGEIERWVGTYIEFIASHQEGLMERLGLVEKIQDAPDALSVEIKRCLATHDARMVVELMTKLKDIPLITELVKCTISYVPRKVTKTVSYPGIN